MPLKSADTLRRTTSRPIIVHTLSFLSLIHILAVESGAGAEEDVVVRLEAEHRVDGLEAGHGNSRWRQPFIDVYKRQVQM